MERIVKRFLKKKGGDYYSKHLSIVSTLLPTNLTSKEIEVLGTFMSLDKSIIEDDMFNSVARKKVMDKLNLSPAGLSNHLKSVVKKKVVEKNEITGKLKMRDILIPNGDKQGYKIILINEDTE